MSQSQPTIELTEATLSRDNRVLWYKLNLAVKAGEFIAVLGPNGSGKTSLLKILLGLLPLSSGDVTILSKPARRGNPYIGYIPQQKGFDADTLLRGRDLVRLGVDGARFGFSNLSSLSEHRIDEALESVGAAVYADMPLGLLSGGEQQRLRIAQALVGKPKILLCDEPLLSLDIASQQAVTKLIDDYRQDNNASVIFVTHEINPVLRYVDRILYLANGRWVIDSPEAVLQSKTLSDLYGANVEVVRVKNQVLVIGESGTQISQEAHHGGEQ